MKHFVVLFFFILLITACSNEIQYTIEEEIPGIVIVKNQSTSTSIPTTTTIVPNSKISIASFNIQIFGKTKRSKPDVMKILIDLVDDYDITAIQEVRDSTLETIPFFVDEINKINNNTFDYIISDRLGRTSAKEQYAFIFNKNTIQQTGLTYQWNDSFDEFEREPFSAQFKSDNFDFVLVNIHTKPTDATNEILKLETVANDMNNFYTNDNDIIILGDFNADGTYFNENINTGIRSDTFNWIIDDNQDTTLTPNNDNTYDRIVFYTNYTNNDFTGSSGVRKWDTDMEYDFAKTVSDHYIVWAEFYTTQDED